MDKHNIDSKILNQFIHKYVDEKKMNINKLLWNSLNSKVVLNLSKHSFDRLNDLISCLPELVYIYDERLKCFDFVNKSNLYKKITGKDEWVEYDLIVFDETTDWFIVITHEDIILTYDRVFEIS